MDDPLQREQKPEINAENDLLFMPKVSKNKQSRLRYKKLLTLIYSFFPR